MSVMSRAAQRHIESGVCGRCPNRTECFKRQDKESWIFSDQFMLCQMTNEPSYQDDDYWVLLACFDGEESPPLTAEEEEELARPVIVEED